jgi:uncharacterized protein (TIGR00251 family)
VSPGASGRPPRLEVRRDAGGALLVSVRVVPRAASDAIAGVREGALVVRLRAPPLEGRANDALVRLLARHLSLPRRDIEIVSGAASRSKRLRIEGLDAAAWTRLAEGR